MGRVQVVRLRHKEASGDSRPSGLGSLSSPIAKVCPRSVAAQNGTFRYDDGVMTDEELTNLDMEQRPHVVVLGAGASRAAFPDSDGSGRRIPVMNDLVPLTGVGELLEAAGIEWRNRNFEELYANLRSDDAHQEMADMLEKHVRSYFEAMRLPTHPCLYDHLLLSLRGKDVIATFNWDPFLLDAYRRNAHVRGLPHVLFLHGCVRAGLCPTHHKAGWLGDCCRECGTPLEPVRLLFPLKDKQYSEDGFIAGQWHNLRIALQDAFILTILGYAAPVSDEEAVSVMKEAWHKVRDRQIEQIELINIAPREELLRSWDAFFTRSHYDIRTSFYQSWCARHPRRSCEACWDQFMEMHVRRGSTIPLDADFVQLADWFHPLLEAERAARSAEPQQE